MRLLTDYEIALVAGGSNGSSITVTGHLPPDPTPDPNDPDPDGPPPTGGGGGLGGTPYTYAEWQASQYAMEGATDYLAQQISDLIKQKSDWTSREYGAVIYMNSAGDIKMSPLKAGMTVAEARAAGLAAPETHIPVPSDLGNGQILAVVHSHPDIGYNNAEDIANRYPSDYAGGGDYWNFDRLVGSGAVASDPRFANYVAFSQYILGPDGVLREFNMSEGHVNAANDQVADRSNLSFDL